MRTWTVESALEVVRPLEGLYSGQLTEEERAAFNYLVSEGKALRSWEYPGGMLGLAKVRLVTVQ